MFAPDASVGQRWLEFLVALGVVACVLGGAVAIVNALIGEGSSDGPDDQLERPDTSPVVPPPNGTRRDAADVRSLEDVPDVPFLRVRVVGLDRRRLHPLSTEGRRRDVSLDYARAEQIARLKALQRGRR